MAGQDSPKEPKNLFSQFPKIELKFPFFNQEKKATTQSAVKEESRIEVIGKGEAENGKQKPNFVRFPNSQSIVPPSIDVELQESSGKTHNPLIIWQVYALGGFLILKWVWARLKERNERAKKESSGDDNRSSDEYELPSYDSE